MREITEAMLKCREMWGDGKEEDPFREGNFVRNNCFICGTFTTRETKNFKEPITELEFYEFLIANGDEAVSDSDRCTTKGGYCMSEQACENRIEANPNFQSYDTKLCGADKVCCSSKYGCEAKGGTCRQNQGDIQGETRFQNKDWNCPRGQVCYVDQADHFNYLQKLQFWNRGRTNILIMDEIRPNQVYAVSYSAPTESCDTCEGIELAVSTGAAAAAGVKTGGLGAAATFIAVRKGTNFLEDQAIETLAHFRSQPEQAILFSTLQNTGKAECNIVSG